MGSVTWPSAIAAEVGGLGELRRDATETKTQSCVSLGVQQHIGVVRVKISDFSPLATTDSTHSDSRGALRSHPYNNMINRPAPTVQTFTGSALLPWLADVARLRIQVFRDWPYLYAGDAESEQRYLQTYVDVPGAMVALCRDGDRVVGASTALPLSAETDEITAPFRSRGYELGRALYLGESVLDPRYRGLGIGVRFFEERERHALRLPGIDTLVFCGVQRAADDTRRPAGYVPLDAFWRKRGFSPCPELLTTMSWREIGAMQESTKPMMFWKKALVDGNAA